MQLSRAYSNRPELFVPIDFNCRDESNRLNVIFGEIRHPADKSRDSHNLGKTTLLHVLDFLLLRGMSSDHLFYKRKERFSDFIFFLEIALNSGDYATVRRSVQDPNCIALSRHADRGRDFANAPDEAWDHPTLTFSEAARLLDGWLDLSILKPYPFRKAITYFLRAQGDYGDELQLQKFQSGKDREWKPFVAHLFGLNEGPIQRKYELDDEIQDLQQKLAEKQSEVQFKEDELPQIRARIAQLVRQVERVESQLDAFSFDSEERRLLTELGDIIERDVAELNERLYNIRYDLQEIELALSSKDRFNLKEIERIFEETKLHFPDQLKKKYEDLVQFNKKITGERNAALRLRKKQLEKEQGELETLRAELDAKREANLRVLRNTDTFDKFKLLQRDLADQKSRLVYLQEQLKRLEQVASIARELREKERERGRVVDEIKALVVSPSPVFERFAAIFNSYCQRVLNHDGLFFFRVNSSGNFDYSIDLSLQGQTGVASSQSEGWTYKKIVCALFDLALLKTYEDAPFFHFVYHDGLLESLDDRKKLALLELIREQIANRKTQYILTVIDTDLPRDEGGKKVQFAEDEIVLRLHDGGQDGRIFRMPEF